MKTQLLTLVLLVGVFFGCEAAEPTIEEPITEETTEEPTEKPIEEGDSGSGGLIRFDDDWSDLEPTGKPVLYLYPEETTQVSLGLDYDGRITAEYPTSINEKWELLAQPDGTLIIDERNYPYIFWEGVSPVTQTFEFTEGFSVSRANYISFLEEKLTLLGLNEKEQADFITYWLPQMQAHEWTTVRFLYEEYAELAKWSIEPLPDTFIRVFVIMEGSDHAVKLPKQNLQVAERKGFTAVEWGGTFFEE